MKLTTLFLLLTTLATAQTASFSDVAPQVGVDATGRSYGISAGDFDNDGREDWYISRHLGPNLLYRNLGNGTFQELGAQRGINYAGDTFMSLWVDIDGDGDLDLYLGNRNETNRLYRNDEGYFTDISTAAGIDAYDYHTRAIVAADVDADGDVDLYAANLNAQNELYLNDGNGTFTEYTIQSGAVDEQIAMAAVFFDYDNDGLQDLYLVHDNNQPNMLYRNMGSTFFANVAEQAGANIAANGMGVDVGDINNDGWLDLYVTNLYENNLLLNLGPDENGVVRFQDISATAGVDDLGMGWGTTFLDYDNDGFLDIYCVNDSNFSPLPNLLYRNRGDLSFELVSEGTVLESMNGGYGTIANDFNNDGQLDLFVCNAGTNEANELFLNEEENDHHYLKVRLRSAIESNTHYIGARLRLTTNEGMVLTREINAGMGFVSQNSTTVHFGLGASSGIQSLEIYPSGSDGIAYLENLEMDKTYLIEDLQNLTVPTRELAELPEFELLSNPVEDRLVLRLPAGFPAVEQVLVSDLAGRSFPVEWMGNRSSMIDVRSLPAGLYQVALLTSEGMAVRKFVKL